MSRQRQKKTTESPPIIRCPFCRESDFEIYATLIIHFETDYKKPGFGAFNPGLRYASTRIINHFGFHCLNCGRKLPPRIARELEGLLQAELRFIGPQSA